MNHLLGWVSYERLKRALRTKQLSGCLMVESSAGLLCSHQLWPENIFGRILQHELGGEGLEPASVIASSTLATFVNL